MTVKQKSAKLHKEKYADLIREMDEKVKSSSLDLDFLDLIPDNEIVDEPIPFPYGTYETADKWV